MLIPSNDYTKYFMLSLNHSYICLQLLKQFIAYEHIEPLPELTLDIGSGITPDIAVFPKTLEPYSRTVFITNNEGERMLHESIVTCADMKINFLQVFP